MLPLRTRLILKQIVSQYIEKAIPVPSQSIAGIQDMKVSSATIRNEMALLEQEGYIFRPHTSAGSVPTDKGYRFFVDALGKTDLPDSEQRMVGHLFHQVEREVEQWLSLSAGLLSQLVKNVAVVTLPRSADSKFKHMELLSLQEKLALAVLVLYGAKVKQKLLSLDQPVSQAELTVISNKYNAAYPGLTAHQIEAKELTLSPLETKVREHLVEMMRIEDEQDDAVPYLDGLHFTLNQPEFARGDRVRTLMELIEYRKLLKSILPTDLQNNELHVVIGKENKTVAMQDCSVVIRQYGLADEAMGAIGVIGPTRMHYSRTIPTVEYLALVLSRLVAGLYGKEPAPPREPGRARPDN